VEGPLFPLEKKHGRRVFKKNGIMGAEPWKGNRPKREESSESPVMSYQKICARKKLREKAIVIAELVSERSKGNKWGGGTNKN